MRCYFPMKVHLTYQQQLHYYELIWQSQIYLWLPTRHRTLHLIYCLNSVRWFLLCYSMILFYLLVPTSHYQFAMIENKQINGETLYNEVQKSTTVNVANTKWETVREKYMHKNCRRLIGGVLIWAQQRFWLNWAEIWPVNWLRYTYKL